MVARKKYKYLCYVLTIALVLSPCTIVLNPCTKVLACPPDCSEEEAAVATAWAEFEQLVNEVNDFYKISRMRITRL